MPFCLQNVEGKMLVRRHWTSPSYQAALSDEVLVVRYLVGSLAVNGRGVWYCLERKIEHRRRMEEV